MTTVDPPIRCLEFFSGIGGLHYALPIAGIHAEVVCAFDVNEVANTVYTHNFGHPPSNKTIERLTAKDLDKYQAEAWLLSPPCQPYTQGGRQMDLDDPRAKPLKHLIDLLPKLSKPPSRLFLENVKNFETSQSRELLITRLEEMGYAIRECLLSPTQFGIPNHRLRYYLMATKMDAPTHYHREVYTEWPFPGLASWDPPVLPELSSFLEEDINEEDYLVPAKYIEKRKNFRFDIVKPTHTSTSCVTKAYGSHHLNTSGSLVQTRHLEVTDYDWSNPQSLLELGLRFLTPTEVARLHAFPLPPKYDHTESNSNSTEEHHQGGGDNRKGPRPFRTPSCQPYLEFPPQVNMSQQYRLLGNSLNCWVVAELYRCCLFIEC
ncbi:S-adenosyl-L-methionine-dependent methyltransferase [Syncephalastrum racemosum]|uniref:S-adenosyl-L-methionine-dependent methyltransferase n=1 Tax=Syncephalastrum racemosum TaxID=13706 RepID=A0A1X2HDP9_SYNRA|nr:S-adenosyl-L-methionine-dependent methyltransferase [Syncephalastrum racemosum]